MTTPTVTIPFKDRFAQPLLSGKKTMTTRTRKMGEVGDIFHAFGGEFKIDAVKQTLLGYVAMVYWQQEGMESVEDFEKIWAEIHPRRGYVTGDKVWVHSFHLIAREE